MRAGKYCPEFVCDGFMQAFVVGQVRSPLDFAQGRLCPYENRFLLRFGGFVLAAVPIYGAAEAFLEIYQRFVAESLFGAGEIG